MKMNLFIANAEFGGHLGSHFVIDRRHEKRALGHI
jgi:hypothetical protein